MGCPIRILRALRLYAAPPERFAGLRVLLQPSAPRHSPRTLCSLFSIMEYRLSCSTAKLKYEYDLVGKVQVIVKLLYEAPTTKEWKPAQSSCCDPNVLCRPGIWPHCSTERETRLP